MEDTVNCFEKFRLTEEEKGFVIGKGDVARRREECERSILGKIYGVNTANFFGVRNQFSKIWSPTGRLTVAELGVNFFQFTFPDLKERDRVLSGGPWFFKEQLMVIHPWAEKLEEDKAKFDRANMWVQVQGLPSHWVSKEVGWKLGKLFPNCSNVLIPESGSKCGRIIKIYVEVELNKQLVRGTKLTLEGETRWLQFSYDNLPLYCYYCGHVGHIEKQCETKKEDAKRGTIDEEQFGDWGELGGQKVIKDASGDSLSDNPVDREANVKDHAQMAPQWQERCWGVREINSEADAKVVVDENNHKELDGGKRWRRRGIGGKGESQPMEEGNIMPGNNERVFDQEREGGRDTV
ncbi:OLC1v1015657C1 [Oldenlandia corymbosa var. corymbosa]|uniref:OLC1v1015657C1 n=1 Tax=Oldenlandia corymbosa var. corymbosa TaxID=529605 RepID=A0AAV1E3L9_OLDCO|nr:OLC1v1015657C1 [Oldenlandia corymbosa var. corymbosa]